MASPQKFFEKTITKNEKISKNQISFSIKKTPKFDIYLIRYSQHYHMKGLREQGKAFKGVFILLGVWLMVSNITKLIRKMHVCSDGSDKLYQQLEILNTFNPHDASIFPHFLSLFSVTIPFPSSLLTPLNVGLKWAQPWYYV